MEQLVIQNKNNEKRIKILEKQLKQSQAFQQSQVVLQPMMDQDQEPASQPKIVAKTNHPKITKTSDGVTIGKGTKINMSHNSTPEARTRLIEFVSGELANCVMQGKLSFFTQLTYNNVNLSAVMTNQKNFDDQGSSQGHILFVKWNNTGNINDQ